MKEAASDAICAERLPGDISQSIKAFVVGPHILGHRRPAANTRLPAGQAFRS